MTAIHPEAEPEVEVERRPDWVMRFGGFEWTSLEVTVGQAVAVVELLGRDSWDNATPTGGPSQCGAWLSILLAGSTGQPLEVCQATVLALRLDELLDTLSR
jgi:hypothetical protein